MSKKTAQLSDDVKGGIAGSLAGLASTSIMYPIDTVSASKQVNQKTKFDNYKIKDLFTPPRKHRYTKSTRSRTDTLKGLKNKFYGGIGAKLMKAVPAAAISFTTYGAARRALDVLDGTNTIDKKAEKTFLKMSQVYRLEKEKVSPKDRFLLGAVPTAVTSGLVTAGLNVPGHGFKKGLMVGAKLSPVFGAAGYFLSPKERTKAIRVD